MQNVKKNWSLRVMGLVLVFTLLSTCLLGNTLAKYITESEGGPVVARVAKWGVEIESEGRLFYDRYTTDEIDLKDYLNEDIVFTVNSTTEAQKGVYSGGANLLAPGTSNGEGYYYDEATGAQVPNKPFKLSITGTPEVAYKMTFAAELEMLGWVIDEHDTPYNPIVWILNGEEISYEDLAALLDVANGVSYGAPNTNVQDVLDSFAIGDVTLFESDGSCTIGWAWYFNGGNDENDTILGNRAANGEAATIEFNFSVSVEQVD